MKLNDIRLTRYLDLQKQNNDRLFKLNTKNRDALLLLSDARTSLLAGEKKLRDLLLLIKQEAVNG